jgi:sugar lactone lactonase YvrE
MPEPQTLMTGLTFPEQPRWHDDRLWFSDWGTHEVIAVDLEGNSEVVLHHPYFPLCVDWLPDARLLLVSAGDARLLRLDADGSLSAYADLSQVSDRPPGNEMVVAAGGRIYVNGGGFDLAAGETFAPGMIAMVDSDRSVRVVADDLAFPNGMHIAADGSTMIVAESYGRRLTAFEIAPDGSLTDRRVWADLGEGVPDGICADAENAVWYADVPNRCCVRVREGGEVLATIELDRGCFACALGGGDRSTLLIAANNWSGPASMFERSDGQLLAVPAPAPGAGWP